MAQNYDYDVVVIGAGIAGMVSAVTANGLGKRVAVVEKRKVGGNCTNFTCIPSKTLIRLSHVNREISRLVSLGLLSGEGAAIESRNVMPHIRSVVAKAYEKDVPETFEHIGITMVSGTATFVDHGNGTGTFDWTPGFTDAGVYNVTFIASDGTLADSELVVITINESGNQAPVISSDGPHTTTENINLNFGRRITYG